MCMQDTKSTMRPSTFCQEKGEIEIESLQVAVELGLPGGLPLAKESSDSSSPGFLSVA